MSPSRQRAWQIKARADGRCEKCGKPRGRSKGTCDTCLMRLRESYRRKKKGRVRVHHCRRCGKTGHDVRTCMEPEGIP